jgi:hypothetical protein
MAELRFEEHGEERNGDQGGPKAGKRPDEHGGEDYREGKGKWLDHGLR